MRWFEGSLSSHSAALQKSPKMVWYLLAVALGIGLLILPLPSASLLLLGSALMIVTFIEPLVGLVLTLVAGPFGALESIILGGTSVDSGQALFALTLISWLAHTVAERRRIEWRLSPAVASGMLVFLGISALSLLHAPSLAAGLRELAKWLEICLVALLIVDRAGRPGAETASGGRKVVRLVLAGVLLTALVQGALGIWQFGLRGDGPEHFAILSGYYRAYGTFEQPNPYAGFLGLVLPIGLGLSIGLIGYWHRRLQISGGAWRDRIAVVDLAPLAAVLVATAAAGMGILMSWSRGAWIGVAAAMSAVVMFLPKRRGIGIAMLVVILGVGVLALQNGIVPQAIAERLTSFTSYVQLSDVRGVDVTPGNYAVLERMAHWQAALGMADSSPWIGIGFGNYEAAYASNALINWPYPLGHAHNYYLNLLAEIGILGLSSYLALWVAIFWVTMRVLMRLPDPERGLGLGLMGSWTHLAVHHLFDKLYVNNTYLLLGALLGILFLLDRGARSERPVEERA